MIVYKKARIMRKNGYYFDDVIVKMEVDKKKVVVPNTVPGDDKKMRAAKGKVLRISNLRNDKTYKKCQSARFGRASHLEYIVGKIAKADGLDTDTDRTCGRGINFFRTRTEAVNYEP
mgnify:CR=1 FL=1